MLISARRAALCPLLAAMTAILTLTSGALARGEEPQENAPGPVLWTLRDDDTTIHLFGLPGYVGEDTRWRNARFDAALEASDRVVLEADRTSAEAQAEIQAVVVELGVFRDGRDLSQATDPVLYDRVETAAMALGIPIAAIQPLKPWLVSVQLQTGSLQRGGWMTAMSPGATVLEAAHGNGAEIDYFEPATFLLRRMADLPETVHLAMLDQAVTTLETRPGEPAEIIDAWSRGDTEEMAGLFHGEGAWADERLRQVMLVERNAAWTESIASMMSTHEGTVFVAVGAGHLVGDDNLVRSLERRGYIVRRQ